MYIYIYTYIHIYISHEFIRYLSYSTREYRYYYTFSFNSLVNQKERERERERGREREKDRGYVCTKSACESRAGCTREVTCRPDPHSDAPLRFPLYYSSSTLLFLSPSPLLSFSLSLIPRTHAREKPSGVLRSAAAGDYYSRVRSSTGVRSSAVWSLLFVLFNSHGCREIVPSVPAPGHSVIDATLFFATNGFHRISLSLSLSPPSSLFIFPLSSLTRTLQLALMYIIYNSLCMYYTYNVYIYRKDDSHTTRSFVRSLARSLTRPPIYGRISKRATRTRITSKIERDRDTGRGRTRSSSFVSKNGNAPRQATRSADRWFARSLVRSNFGHFRSSSVPHSRPSLALRHRRVDSLPAYRSALPCSTPPFPICLSTSLFLSLFTGGKGYTNDDDDDDDDDEDDEEIAPLFFATKYIFFLSQRRLFFSSLTLLFTFLLLLLLLLLLFPYPPIPPFYVSSFISFPRKAAQRQYASADSRSHCLRPSRDRY
uniref:uncharacterized protein LOC127064859 n=1 Tax=Vespula vulgaris TaxID=7454 RepID=UPI00223B2934|nr:uncharacterized protein LOC127064859 [Vespula vulgaris]